MFVIATKRSPIDINKIILREFVLKSGHITNVIMITRAPIIESPAAVVDKTLFISPCANSVWGPDVVYSRVYSEIFWDAMLILFSARSNIATPRNWVLLWLRPQVDHLLFVGPLPGLKSEHRSSQPCSLLKKYRWKMQILMQMFQ